MHILDNKHKAFIKEHAGDNTHRLLLSATRYPGINMSFAVQQIEGRRKAAEKFPSLADNDDFIYPVKLSMEQCSSEQTALYKASLVEDLSVADLTGGLGIDALFMSNRTKDFCYVERNEELMQIATHNFEVCKAGVESFCGEGFEFLQKENRHFDCIYLDPARRDDNKNKVAMLESCEPNVPANLAFLWLYTDKLLIKASPMLDISQAVKELGCVERVHVVAVRNECKELLFECRQGASAYGIVCVNLESSQEERFCFTPEDESQSEVKYALQPGTYLYEPNVSLLKAGAFRLVASRFELQKLHPDTHLYTSDRLVPDFPGRIFRVFAVASLNKQTIKEFLPQKKVNVSVRNFPAKPEDIKKKFGLTDGGDLFLFAATLSDRQKKAVLCTKA